MNVRRSFVQTGVALAVVVAMPLLGLSGVASAKATHATKSAAWCAKHPKKKALCPSGAGSGSGGASGQNTPEIIVNADFSPVIQIEANPQFAGDPVDISSSQLTASCDGVVFLSVATGTLTESINHFTAILDDDGNATVIMEGEGNCAPGDNIIDVSLDVAPYYTALGDYVNSPETPTPPGVFGLPLPNEVETGDSLTSGDSDVYAAFAIEAPPVYAEQDAEISDNQLESSCGGGYYWINGFGVPTFVPAVGPGVPQVTTPPIQTPLDDDGNGGALFLGISCAAATSEVIGDVEAGDHETYTSTFTVTAPEPTI